MNETLKDNWPAFGSEAISAINGPLDKTKLKFKILHTVSSSYFVNKYS
jgi:hypothetical protein